MKKDAAGIRERLGLNNSYSAIALILANGLPGAADGLAARTEKLLNKATALEREAREIRARAETQAADDINGMLADWTFEEALSAFASNAPSP